MADLFSRSFRCLLVPSCNLPPKSTERLRISAPIPLPKRRVRLTRHSHTLANSTSSASSSSSNSVPEDYDILSSTDCSDGSVLFRFGNASEIREKMAKLEQEKLAREGVEEGDKARVRPLASESSEKLNTTEVDHNLEVEIGSSSNVVVGVANHNVQLSVNGEGSVALDNDSETAVINDSQEDVECNLGVDIGSSSNVVVGVADQNGQLSVNGEGSVTHGNDSETAVINDSQEDVEHNVGVDIGSSSNVIVGVADQNVQLLVNGEGSVALDNDSEADVINGSKEEVDCNLEVQIESLSAVVDGAADHNVQISANSMESAVLDNDSEREIAVVNDSQEIDRNVMLDSEEGAQSEISHEDVVAEDIDVQRDSAEDSEADSHNQGNNVQGVADEDSEAGSQQEVVVSVVSLESNMFSDLTSVASGESEEKEEADKGDGVDREITNLIGGVDAESVSPSLESEQVAIDKDATEPIAGVASAADNVSNGADVDTDLRELIPASTSLESEQVAEDEETTHNIVEVEDAIDTSKMEKSMLLPDMVQSTELENKIDVGNTEGSDYDNPSLPTEPETDSVETACHGEKVSRTELFLISGAASFPHPSKMEDGKPTNNNLQASAGREDAYFIFHDNWLGVADGIGHWSLEGDNTGLYMRELMEKCEHILSNHENISTVKPAEVITRSALETQSHGSSAILVSHFDGQALHAANVGNTGFIVIRDGSIFKKSTPMFHEFNFPLQIVKGDDPSESIEVYKIELEDGDVVISATNGVFDNLYEKEIVSIISKSLHASLRPQEIAEFLATRALEVGISEYSRSPFADEAQALGYVGYTGGKLDDVTVIVSLVKTR